MKPFIDHIWLNAINWLVEKEDYHILHNHSIWKESRIMIDNYCISFRASVCRMLYLVPTLIALAHQNVGKRYFRFCLLLIKGIVMPRVANAFRINCFFSTVDKYFFFLNRLQIILINSFVNLRNIYAILLTSNTVRLVLPMYPELTV